MVIINYPSSLPQKVNIHLYDISGRVLVQKGFSTSKGINQFSVSAKQRGLYFVNILAGDNCYNAKVILKGQGNNNIGLLGYSEFKNSNKHIKSIGGDSYVMLYSEGDIISYELSSGKTRQLFTKK